MPHGSLIAKMRTTVARELVVTRPPPRLRLSPLTRHPPTLGQPVQCGIKCAFLDEQEILGRTLDPLGDRVPVLGPPGERLEDEEVETLAEDVEIGVRHRFP